MLFPLIALAVSAIQPMDLSVWRKQDARGQACVSCHSPDGIELGAYRFAEADVVRRAAKHLPEVDQAKILALIEQQRSRFASPMALDPMKDRPLQPGGDIVDGDVGFATELKTTIPTLMGSSITSLAAAQKAQQEIVAIDLHQLKVGFPMSRLSEDAFHGSDHATMAQWLPDTPITISNEVLQAQDKYLADPTVANLRTIDDAVLKANVVRSPIELFSLNKYRSMLVLQHRLRVEAGIALQPLTTPIGKEVRANPFWLVADAARVYDQSDIKALLLPEDVAAAKTVDYKQQLKSLRAPWYWMGWVEDPCLSRSGRFPETQTGQYFIQTLLQDGPYPVHALFAVTRRMAQLGVDKSAWTAISPQHFEIQYSAFAVTASLKETPRGEAFEHLLANSFRMALYLALDDVQRTGKAIRPESQIGQIKFVMSQTPGLTSADKQLADKTMKKLAAAKREFSR